MEGDGRAVSTIVDWKTTEHYIDSWKLPFVESCTADSVDAAAEYAEKRGRPLVVKGVSSKLTHKSENGLVQLKLEGGKAVAEACRRMEAVGEMECFLLQDQVEPGFEMIVGIIRDSLFGPMVLFGPGGIFVDLLSDSQMLRPPFSAKEVERSLKGMNAYSMLTGFRGGAVYDLDAFTQLLVQIGDIAAKLDKGIESVDFNPVILHKNGLDMVDIRISSREVDNG